SGCFHPRGVTTSPSSCPRKRVKPSLAYGLSAASLRRGRASPSCVPGPPPLLWSAAFSSRVATPDQLSTPVSVADMRALQLTGWKQDAELREVPQPAPGPGEVLVRMGGAGACHSDMHLMYDFAPGLLPWGPPFTLGHENAGWVEATGPGVHGVEVGEPVAVY